jgi:hypothetical protein
VSLVQQRKTSVWTSFGFVAYWLLHACNAVRTSKFPGYHPPAVRTQAATLLAAGPYPWNEILKTWVLFGLLTAGLFLIYRFGRRRGMYLALYVIALFAVDVIVTPADVGGVAYARMQYTLTTAACVIVYSIAMAMKRAGSAHT